MEYDLNKIVEKMVYDYVQRLLPLMEAGKDRFTAEEVAERYGIHKDNARRMMNNGDFGEVIRVSPRRAVVTLAGLLDYEERRKGLSPSPQRGAAGPGRRKGRGKAPAVGRI